MTKARKNPLRVDFNLHSDFKVIWVVQSLAQKHFAGFVGQISSPVRAISSPGGADRDRHERGMGCGGRDSVGAQSVRRAVSVSEQWRARRTALFPPSPGFRRKGTRPGEASWQRRGRVRQNRVVLTPVAGAKSAEASRPNRAWASHQSVDDGDKTNSSPGRARHKP
jgi:hypothetical protein